MKTLKAFWKMLCGKAETAAAILLFFTMLLGCGLYIDIKINGKGTSAQNMPENDKRVLLRTVTSDNIREDRSLVTPIFIGTKLGDNMNAAAMSAESRTSLLARAEEYLVPLFSGVSEEMTFVSDEARRRYFDELCTENSYIILSYYKDLPASVFLPLFAKEYENSASEMVFNIQNLFILPDSDNNVYAVAISGDLSVNIITPYEPVPFDSQSFEAYNDNAGFSEFTFEKSERILPVFTKSFQANNYSVLPAISVLGSDAGAEWIIELLKVFDFNENLARSFYSKDQSVLNYVYDGNELAFGNDGTVSYSATDDGIDLSEYLGYYPDGSVGYTFSDKVIAVKNIINVIGKASLGNDAELCLVNIAFAKNTDKLTFEMKYFVDGIAVTENEADAVVELMDDKVISAQLSALLCTRLETLRNSMPQNTVNSIISDRENAKQFFAVLSPAEEDGSRFIKWASIVDSANSEQEGE